MKLDPTFLAVLSAVGSCSSPPPARADFGAFTLTVPPDDDVCKVIGASSDSISFVLAPPADTCRQFGVNVIMFKDTAAPTLVGTSNTVHSSTPVQLSTLPMTNWERYAVGTFRDGQATPMSVEGKSAWYSCNEVCVIVYRHRTSLLRVIWNNEETPLRPDDAARYVENKLVHWSR